MQHALNQCFERKRKHKCLQILQEAGPLAVETHSLTEAELHKLIPEDSQWVVSQYEDQVKTEYLNKIMDKV